MKKTGLFAFITAAALMVTASGCGSKNTGSGDTAFEIGGHKITMADVSVVIQGYEMNGLEFDAAKDMAVKDVKSAFEAEELAKKLGIELTDEDEDSIIIRKARLVTSNGMKNSEYEKYLKSAGTSMDFIKAYSTAMVYGMKLNDQMMSSDDEKFKVSDEDMGEVLKERYYRAKHILVAEPVEGATAEPESEVVTEEDGKKGEELANLILEKAKNGENFDEMITKYNTDPGMAQNPDGYVFTDGAMVQEFEDCVKGLQPGEFGIAKTSYGYHIIQRLSLDGSEENFSKWVEDNSQDLKMDALLKKNNIAAKVNQDTVDAYKEDQMVTPAPVE